MESGDETGGKILNNGGSLLFSLSPPFSLSSICFRPSVRLLCDSFPLFLPSALSILLSKQ